MYFCALDEKKNQKPHQKGAFFNGAALNAKSAV
jgi:hypothetical protein